MHVAVVAEDDVVAVAALERVVACAADQDRAVADAGAGVARDRVVVARARSDRVDVAGEVDVAGVAEDDVATQARRDRVLVPAADRDVRAVAAVERVVAPERRVGGGGNRRDAARREHRAVVAEEDVVARGAGGRIAGHCVAVEEVVAEPAEQDVRTAVTDQVVGAIIALAPGLDEERGGHRAERDVAGAAVPAHGLHPCRDRNGDDAVVQGDGARVVDERDAASVADEDVVAGAADQRVVTLAAEDDERQRRAGAVDVVPVGRRDDRRVRRVDRHGMRDPDENERARGRRGVEDDRPQVAAEVRAHDCAVDEHLHAVAADIRARGELQGDAGVDELLRPRLRVADRDDVVSDRADRVSDGVQRRDDRVLAGGQQCPVEGDGDDVGTRGVVAPGEVRLRKREGVLECALRVEHEEPAVHGVEVDRRLVVAETGVERRDLGDARGCVDAVDRDVVVAEAAPDRDPAAQVAACCAVGDRAGCEAGDAARVQRVGPGVPVALVADHQ